MAKSSPLARPDVVHHGPRNAFDRSRKALFQANPGQLLPFFWEEVNPGDHLEISENSFTRTMPCETAAYVRMKEHREFFFVPYRYLWSYWEGFISQVNDFNSTALEDNTSGFVPNTVPMLSLLELMEHFLYNSDSDPDYIGSQRDLGGSQYAYNFLRLFNHLGYGSLRVGYDTSQPYRCVDTSLATNVSDNIRSKADYGLNPFRILAYQKIFYDYYRPSDWMANIVGAYNIDSPVQDEDGYFRPRSSILTNMWTLHYRPWKKDYFTSMQPSTYWFGSIYQNQPQSGIGVGTLTKLPTAYTSSGLSGSPYGTAMQVGISVDAPFLSTNAVRVAFALDKYLRTTQKAGKHYDDQILAHFGEKVNPDIAKEVRLIGSFEQPLVINEVTATADTASASGGAAVGTQFGKGFADGTNNPDVIKFDAHEHGIVMGIYSVGIESDYSARGIDPFNFKRFVSDYYMPELDEIGPHVIFPEQVDINVLSDNYSDIYRNSIFGLTQPYAEYKIPVDRVFGDLMNGESLQKWTASRQFKFDPNQIVGTLYRNLSVSDLFIDPRVVDYIFGVSTALTECLLVNDYTICKKVSNMSVHGEPRLS